MAARRSKAIRYGVVGLGHIAQVAMLPAFAHARRNSRLTALVSDDPRQAQSSVQEIPGRRHLLIRRLRGLPRTGGRGLYRAAQLDARRVHDSGGAGRRPRAV